MSRNIELEQWLQVGVLRQFMSHLYTQMYGNYALEISDNQSLVVCLFEGDTDEDCAITLEFFVEVSDYSAEVNISCEANSKDWSVGYSDDFALELDAVGYSADLVNAEHVEDFCREVISRVVAADLPDFHEIKKGLKACFVGVDRVK